MIVHYLKRKHVICRGINQNDAQTLFRVLMDDICLELYYVVNIFKEKIE